MTATQKKNARSMDNSTASTTSPDRRHFLKQTTAIALTAGVHQQVSAKESSSPNEKVQILTIGTANRASNNIEGVINQSIIGVCDVDTNFLNKAKAKIPAAKTFQDYREMIDQMADQADGILVSTADHHHAPAAIRAMKAGLHCYCEKPLAHTVAEARKMTEVAAQTGVVTQMGTQIHAGANYRRVVERVRSGVLGSIHRVHVWVGKGWGGGDRPAQADPVPKHLDWDLWLGPAPVRPYAKGRYHPAQWRRWWDFGQGTLGDMACHYMDLPFWALDLKSPTQCSAEGPDVHPETCPTGLVVNYKFPANDDRGPVDLIWYDGDRAPSSLEGIEELPRSGVLFVGSEGMMYANYGSYKLYPESKFADSPAPDQTIAPSIGHHAEWIRAIRGGETPLCHFGYSGPLTESVLLGNVAFRTGKTLDWDAENLKASNAPEADALIHKTYRSGWEIS